MRKKFYSSRFFCYTLFMIPGKAREDLVSGLGTVAGSCARICLMAYLKINIKNKPKLSYK